MRIKQILESVSAGGMGTNSVATAPAKAGKMIKREKGNLLAQEDQGVEEVSTGDYYKKATMQRAQAGMSAGFARSPEEREKNLAIYNKRDKGLNRLKDRNEKARAADQQKQMADLVARLPELEAEYEQMKAKYKSLGGSNWQYADRDQNLTPAEREARSMEGSMNNLWRQIQAAKKHQGMAEGLPQTLRKVVPGYAKREIDKKMDAGKFGKTDADKDANFQRYKKIQDKLKEQGVAEGYNSIEKDYEQWEQALYPHGNGASAFDLIDGDETTIRNILTYVKQNRHVLGYEVSPESGRTVKDAIINIRNEFPELYQAAQQPQGVAENKKGVRAVKHTVKPRNFVAKNAVQSGAGAHKDKKKAQKQGDVKHKGKELAYESRLWAALDRKISK